MGLAALVKDLSAVAEGQRSLYVAFERAGEAWHRLDVDPVEGFSLEDVGGLKKALTTERELAGSASRRVKLFHDSLGDNVDPSTIATQLAELDALKALDPDKEADKIASAKFESWKTGVIKENGKEKTVLQQTITGLETEITSYLVDGEIARVLNDEDTKGSYELLAPVLRGQVRVIRDDASGKRVAVAVDEAGTPRVGDSGGGYLGIKGLAKELKGDQTFARAFDGSKVSGSDSGRIGIRTPGRLPVTDNTGLTAMQKIKQGLEAL